MSIRLPDFLRDVEGICEFPVGFVARFEPHHKKYFNGISPVRYLLIKIDDVNRLLSLGETAESYFDSKYTIITTSTIEDKKLEKMKLDEERDIVKQFGPDFHIPADHPAYPDMDSKVRMNYVSECMEGTKWMAKELSNTNTRIIPLIKGFTKEERSICYRTYDELGIKYCAYYGSQHFGGKIGNQFGLLRKDIVNIAAEYPYCGIFLIGLLSPNSLIKLPPQIVAAAGNKWIHECTKKCSDINIINEKLKRLKNRVEGTLCMGQMVIPFDWGCV